MQRFGLLGLLGIAMLLVSPHNVSAQQRGGVIRGGIGGALVGGLLGGKKGARVGAAIGAVSGGIRQANRNQAYRNQAYNEAQARAAYRATPTYQQGVHSNFYAAPPRIFVRPPAVRR